MSSFWTSIAIVTFVALAIPAFMAWLCWSIFRKELKIAPAIIFTLAGTAALSNYAYSLTSDCYYSYRLSKYINANLSQSEISTLKPDSLICPMSYTFIRSGTEACVISIMGEPGAGKCP